MKSTLNNNKNYKKRSSSMKRINPSNKLNLSIMDEKLTLLNSDIEELYKKYIEKKSLRKRKEKSEQTLASRINFLIDEERKIRNQIENKLIKNHHCAKNRSVKILKTQEILTNSGTIRYSTIESYDNSPRSGNGKFRYNNSNRIYRKKYINTIENDQLNKMIKKNGINDLTISSIQNNSSIENNNLTIGNRSNVTNNVCIIINNSDKSNALGDSNKKYVNGQDLSFADKESSFNNKKNVNKSKKFNINEALDKKENNNVKNYINIREEDEDEKKINDEINIIKMRLASKLSEEIMKSMSQTYQQKDEISLNKKINSLYINGMTEKKEDYNLKTPTFKDKINIQNQNKSLKATLYSKRKIIKNIENEIDLKQNKCKEDKNNLENKILIKSKNNNNHDKILNKRCFSKPNNRFNIKNKIQKNFNFNRNNIKNNGIIIENKSHIIDKINHLNNKIKKVKENEIDYKNLSIDSGDIILPEANSNISNHKKVSEKKNIRAINTNIKTKIENKIHNRENKKEDKNMYYSSPKELNKDNLTFKQSIEKKRQLLGIPLNARKNLNKKMEEISLKSNSDKNCEEKIENIYYHRKNENNKFTKIIYNKKNISKKNNNIIAKPKNKDKDEINLNNIISPYKENHYDNDKKYRKNNIRLFSNSNLKKNIFSNKDKDKSNKNIASSSSLTSLFSTQTNRTNKGNKNLFRNKNNDYDSINKSNISYLTNITNTKIKKNKKINIATKSKCDMIIKKNENKNYMNTIRIIKKRDKNGKNTLKEEPKQIKNEQKDIKKNNNNSNSNIENKSKIYENAMKPSKELAVIRRIKKRIENYKKNGPQVYQISKRHNKDLELYNNMSNSKCKGKGKFTAFRRLSGIQKKQNYSFSYQNMGVMKSKSNKSLTKSCKNNNSFNF